MNDIIELSKTYNSLEISRLLHLPVEDVEIELINFYWQPKWLLTKEQLLEIAAKIYRSSGALLGKSYNVSEPTIKLYLRKCHLYNDKQYIVSPNNNNFDEKEICDAFIKGESAEKIGLRLGVNRHKVCSILHNNGINPTQLCFDETVFDKIDTEEKAYWLGFIYADGAIGLNNNSLEVSLKVLDVEHLHKLCKFFKSDRIPKLDYEKNAKRSRVQFSSKHLKERLIALGCTPQKSLTLKFPTEEYVPKELIIPFLRGYFDGDGILSYSYKHKRICTHVIPNVGFIGTEDFIIHTLEQFPNLKNKNYYLSNKNGDPRCKQITWGKNDSILVLSVLYDNATIYLNRKYSRFQKFKENNFAVQRSDFLDNDRVISEKALNFINTEYNLNLKLEDLKGDAETKRILKEVYSS